MMAQMFCSGVDSLRSEIHLGQSGSDVSISLSKPPPRKSGKVFGGGGLQLLEGGNWVLDQKTALRFVH